MEDIRKIKSLKTEMNKLKAQYNSIQTEVSNKQRELSSKYHAISDIQNQIDRLEKNHKIKVTEHAIIRYLERVKGIDFSEIEKEIITPEVISFVNQLGGNGSYPTKNFKVVMKNNSIVTIKV